MEIQGKIIQIGQVQSGRSQKGNDWAKQDFVIETEEKFPKKIAMTIMKQDLINAFYYYQVGYNIKCSINIESKEYNGKWYTQVNVWKFEGDSNNPKPGGQHEDYHSDGTSDDLPF